MFARALPVLRRTAVLSSLTTHGGIRCRHKAREEAAEHALEHYRALGLSTSTPLGEIAASLYYGPAPVDDGIARCKELLEDESTDRVGEANVLAFLGGLEAQRGDFARARDRVGTALMTYDDLGHAANAMTYGYPVLGDIEMLAGNPREAEAILVELCGKLERTGSWNHLSTRAADLAEALCAEHRYDDAQRWVDVSATRNANDDLATAIRLAAVQSTLFSASGDLESAVRSARRAVGLAATTDALNLQGKALTALATCLSARGDDAGARAAVGQAEEAYRAKGNLVGIAAISEVGRQETLKAR